MRAARLHGIRDLRVEELPDPVAAHGELLIRVEACGICPTDVRNTGSVPLWFPAEAPR